MSTCSWLDLQTLGSQPVIMPKNLPDHCHVPLAAIDGTGRPIQRNDGFGGRCVVVEVHEPKAL